MIKVLEQAIRKVEVLSEERQRQAAVMLEQMAAAGGSVVVEIVPATSTNGETEDELLARLVRQGLACAPLTPPGTPLPPRLAATMTLEELMRDLDESRADR